MRGALWIAGGAAGLAAYLAAVSAIGLDDLWANIGPAEVRQLQPETVDLCQFVHEVRDHGAHWSDWKHQR
jgi:hypothetical protein